MTALPASIRIESHGRLAPALLPRVFALVDDATDTDGVQPLSEHVVLHLRYGGDERGCNLLLWVDDDEPRLAGYAHLDATDPVEAPSAELVIAPDFRGRGLGTMLVEAILARTGGRLRLWAHGELPAAQAMARRLGFARRRVLLQMRRDLFAPLPPVTLPDDVRIRTFRPGADDDAWIALNARAFADHPEQGSWTLEDLHRRMQESWFDPDGFFLAERDGELVGFHWTKVHGSPAGQASNGSSGHGHEPLGEVYILGVDPKAQGLGLGRALTIVGLRYLRSRRLPHVMLYVDATNAPAIRLYESLGFQHWGTDVLFERGGTANGEGTS